MQQTWAAPSYQNSYNEAHSFAEQNRNFALALCASGVFEFAQRDGMLGLRSMGISCASGRAISRRIWPHLSTCVCPKSV